MKAYLELIGETRLPKKGELYLASMGQIFTAGHDYQNDRYPMVTRHEIEIPDYVDAMNYGFSNSQFTGIRTGSIPIPRPKKKAKKWKYAFVVANEIVCQTQHLSEDEVARMTCYGPKRIDETEIEVEE